MSGLLALAAAAVLPTCVAGAAAIPGTRPVCVPATAPDWRAAVTRDDLVRLRDWREAFVRALDEARAAGHGEAIAAESPLLEPDAGQDAATLPDGRYSCRTIKLGTGGGTTALGYVAYPRFRCEVRTSGGVTMFEKMTGSQRAYGRIYPGGERQQMLLATLVLGDENRALAYGRDPQRDMVGRIERVAPGRWRIVFPYPRFESTLDVVELTPLR